MEKGNFILNLYPSTKFMLPLFVTISIFFVPGYLYAYLMLPLCILIAFFAGKAKELVNLVVKGLLVLVLFIFIIQSVIAPGEEIFWSWGIISIKQEGVMRSLSLTSKIIAIASAFLLFFRITPVKDISQALERIGMSPKFSYAIIATFQFIPEISNRSKVIMEAQKSRGVETEGNLLTRAKAFIPVLGPLVLSSITSTEERAIALETRAFSAIGKKTSLNELTKRRIDYIIQVAMVILLTILLIGRIWLWN
ncbi:energy-coupling factor transporter transmembrane component T [Salinibacillus aidingensis]|uniref:Energy-coupling factor transporter transmembrane component T n=1 Tax=Salinibacillus aidingensis TaxID=237684 RepID=A0ABN1AYY6_9BACI